MPAGPNSSVPSRSASGRSSARRAAPSPSETVEVRRGVQHVEGGVHAEEDPAQGGERRADRGEGHGHRGVVRIHRRGGVREVGQVLSDVLIRSLLGRPLQSACQNGPSLQQIDVLLRQHVSARTLAESGFSLTH